jgi:hypothetical protein
LTLLMLCCRAQTAQADFLVSPFFGPVFGGNTTLLDLDIGAATSQHWVFGAAVGWLSDQILGAEADFATIPGFFENSEGTGLVTASRVSTISGNVIAALPLSITHESLRPYVTGGLGLMRASIEDLIGLTESNNLLAMQVGGGAIGFIGERAGLRFDLRHSRALERDLNLRGDKRPKLSFWRATVGVTIRY